MSGGHLLMCNYKLQHRTGQSYDRKLTAFKYFGGIFRFRLARVVEMRQDHAGVSSEKVRIIKTTHDQERPRLLHSAFVS